MRLLLAAGAIGSFNYATGGSETVISNYNGTGQTWRVHQFTSSGTLEIVFARRPFSILVVGGGGGGGGLNASRGGGGGGGGGVVDTAVTVNGVGSYTVTVGLGGAARTNGATSSALGQTAGGGLRGFDGATGRGITGGTSGTPQSFSGGLNSPNTFTGGGGGGAGGAGFDATDGGNGNPGPGLASSVSGTSVVYAPGGIGFTATPGADGLGGGGGGGTGGPGGAGLVIVAYQIG